MTIAVSVGLAFAAIIGVCLFVLWYGSATVIDKHEDRITVMERRWAEAFGGPKPAGDDDATLKSVDTNSRSALLRPSPVPREAEMVERTVNIGGTLQTFRIPAREDT